MHLSVSKGLKERSIQTIIQKFRVRTLFYEYFYSARIHYLFI